MASDSGSDDDGPVSAPIKFPLVVRFGKRMGRLMIAVGLFWVIAALAAGPGALVGGLLGGGLIVAVGATQLSGKDYVVIRPKSVTVKSQIGSTTKTVPISGIQDLQVVGKKLIRRSDGKKIAKIFAFGTDHDDAAAVTAAIANAGTVAR